uniref:Uncharacterized protein n=1 Tax=Anguilla anguilla TaxID=7936 RepID=A0A0E9V0E2_ANGAN
MYLMSVMLKMLCMCIQHTCMRIHTYD